MARPASPGLRPPPISPPQRGSVRRPHASQSSLTVLIKVQVRPNESLESALRRFKRQCNYSGIFRLFKARTWHEKRSDKRRRERRERLRTVLKAARKNDPNFRGRNARPNRARRARRARPQSSYGAESRQGAGASSGDSKE